MDYFDLLNKAQKNSQNVAAKEIRCYSTTFTAPKKLDRNNVSKENIKKFLARKEEEERKKLEDAESRKQKLLALRALDKKSQKRVQVMLKRTKSANKSVMEDAIDTVNTADTLAGPQMCDDDDYGYVSQEASQLYEKLLSKYQNVQSENKAMVREVKDLSAAKDRVKAALQKQEEEELNPTRKRRKKSDKETSSDTTTDASDGIEKNSEVSNSNASEGSERNKETKPVKPKPLKKAAPPPVDFNSLLKLAEQKQHEPIVIEKKVDKGPERPMTMKQKMEYQQELESKHRKKSGKLPGTKPKVDGENSLPAKTETKTIPATDITAKNIKNHESKGKTLKKVKFSEQITQQPKIEKKIESSRKESNLNHEIRNPKVDEPIKEKSIQNYRVPLKQTTKSPNLTSNSACKQAMPKSEKYIKSKLVDNKNNHLNSGKINSNDNITQKKEKQIPPSQGVDDIDKEIELLLLKKKQLLQNKKEIPVTESSVIDVPGARISAKEKPIIKDQNKSNPTSHKKQVSEDTTKRFLDSKRAPATKSMIKKNGPAKKSRVIESDSEYDSELDGFIDDDPIEEMNDYSKHIREIFGYDRTRYAGVDEGECLEASFRTQELEEKRSLKIGIMEDLEDIRREKEEKARALVRKKMKKCRPGVT